MFQINDLRHEQEEKLAMLIAPVKFLFLLFAHEKQLVVPFSFGTIIELGAQIQAGTFKEGDQI